MGLDDGLTVAYHETRIRRSITAYVRAFKPHIVFTHFPNAIYEASPTCNGNCPSPNNWDDFGFHPDHQHVGKLVFNTLYGSGSASDNDKLFVDLVDAGNLEKWKVERNNLKNEIDNLNATTIADITANIAVISNFL